MNLLKHNKARKRYKKHQEWQIGKERILQTMIGAALFVVFSFIGYIVALLITKII